MDEVRKSYERLAYGAITDAVALVVMDNPTPELVGKLNLFTVKAIRRSKDGSLEVEFYDRFQALEALRNYDKLARDDELAHELIGAIDSSAEVVD